ncbi:MAG: ATP-binding cassette domain-containing protein [Lachnospiraceae bacterium]|nr:ATP-binding cassette domain-containing protein [Lachnospiraceae bacterium]
MRKKPLPVSESEQGLQNPPGSILSLRGVTIWLPPDRMLLYRQSLDVGPGEHILILGRAGSGKTCLFRCLCGRDAFQEGEVILFGKRLGPGREASWRQVMTYVGVIPEGNSFFSSLTCLDNLRLAENRRRDGSGKTKRETVQERNFWLERLGLRHMEGRRVDSLSPEERCRLNLARACQRHPRLILADHFTRELSPEAEEKLWRDWEAAAAEHFLPGNVPAWVHLSDRQCPGEPADRVRQMENGQTEWGEKS